MGITDSELASVVSASYKTGYREALNRAINRLQHLPEEVKEDPKKFGVAATDNKIATTRTAFATLRVAQEVLQEIKDD